MTNLTLVLQSSIAIFIFFIANALTNARFFPSRLAELYDHVPTMFGRMMCLGLPAYAVGILLLADAFDKNATVTGPTILFANILATIVTTIALDGLTPNLRIGMAAILCLSADLFLYYALRSSKG